MGNEDSVTMHCSQSATTSYLEMEPWTRLLFLIETSGLCDGDTKNFNRLVACNYYVEATLDKLTSFYYKVGLSDGITKNFSLLNDPPIKPLE